MKKKTIQLLVVLVLLVGAIGAFLLLNRTEPPAVEETSAVEQVFILGGVPQPFVKSVSIQNELDTYTITNLAENAVAQANTATELSVNGVETVDLNTSLVKSILTNVASLTAVKEITSPGGLDTYGLTAPVAIVEVAFESGTEKMLIGAVAPGSEGTYVQVGERVYLAPTSKLTNMLQSRLGFINKTVTTGAADSAVFTKFTLSGRAYPQPVVVEKLEETSEASSMMGIGSYQISAPIRAGLDLNVGITNLSAVFGITGESVVSMGDGDLAEYGLTEPYVTAQVTAEDPAIGSFTLHLSEPDAQDMVYLQREGAPYVYRLPATSVPWASMSLFDLREKMVILPFIDSVAAVEVKTADAAYTFHLSGEGDELKVTLDGKELEANNFRKFYQTLIAASYDSEIQPNAAPESEEAGENTASEEAVPADAASVSSVAAGTQLSVEDQPVPMTEGTALLLEDDTAELLSGEIILQYTYTYRDSKTPDVVRFSPGPSRKVIISFNDGPAYYAKSIYVDRVLEDLPKVLTGEQVKSYY